MPDDDPPPGVPEWVVTYGDMMSLLLTFFIMLVSMSEVASDQKYRAIMESLQQYLGYRAGPVAPPGKNFPLNSLIEALTTLGSYTNQDVGRGGVRIRAPEGQNARVLRSREGERLRVGEPILFEPGSADLSEATKASLKEIARELAGKPNKVEIRAHVAPSADASDSELDRLCYRRGRAIVQALEAREISHERLRITIAANKEPLPEHNDQRLQQHDRVEILLLDEFAATYIGPRTTPQ